MKNKKIHGMVGQRNNFKGDNARSVKLFVRIEPALEKAIDNKAESKGLNRSQFVYATLKKAVIE